MGKKWKYCVPLWALSCVLEPCEPHAQETALFPLCVGTALVLQPWRDVQKGVYSRGDSFTGTEMDCRNSSPLGNVICWQQQLLLDSESSNTNSPAETLEGFSVFLWSLMSCSNMYLIWFKVAATSENSYLGHFGYLNRKNWIFRVMEEVVERLNGDVEGGVKAVEELSLLLKAEFLQISAYRLECFAPCPHSFIEP